MHSVDRMQRCHLSNLKKIPYYKKHATLFHIQTFRMCIVVFFDVCFDVALFHFFCKIRLLFSIGFV